MHITRTTYGQISPQPPVELFTLDNDRGTRISVTNYGAILTHLQTPDRHGNVADIVLGCATLKDYVNDQHHFGSTIGRFAGPVDGGQTVIDGQTHALPLNAGTFHIHGGQRGFDRYIWMAQEISAAHAVGVKFSRISPDGEEGYPGTLAVAITYILNQDNELHLHYDATTDKPTLVNLTNHSYFNLGGHASGPIEHHILHSSAIAFNHNDRRVIPTSVVSPVRGTPLDFNIPTAIGKRINDNDEQIWFSLGYDHMLLLPREHGMQWAARVVDPHSGRILDMHTTEPGFQLYTANMLPDGTQGKDGAVYGRRQGICLEAQRVPNWPEHPHQTAASLRPGEHYTQTTVFKFSTDSGNS
jgi:aldose 1-epimerase